MLIWGLLAYDGQYPLRYLARDWNQLQSIVVIRVQIAAMQSTAIQVLGMALSINCNWARIAVDWLISKSESVPTPFAEYFVEQLVALGRRSPMRIAICSDFFVGGVN